MVPPRMMGCAALIVLIAHCRGANTTLDLGDFGPPTNSLQRQVVARLQQIKDSGEPLTFDELREWVPKSSGKDEALAAWTNAFASIRQTRLPFVWPLHNVLLAAKTNREYRVMVATNHLALDRLIEASQKPESSTPIFLGRQKDPVHLSDQQMMFYDGATDAGNLLFVSVALQIIDGHYDEAISSIRVLTALSQFLEHRRDYLSERETPWLYIGVATEWLLSSGSLSLDQLSKLQEIFRSEPSNGWITELLVQSRCRQVQDVLHWERRKLPMLVVAAQYDKGSEFNAEELHDFKTALLTRKDADFLRYLDAMKDLIAASRISSQELIQKGKALVDRVMGAEPSVQPSTLNWCAEDIRGTYNGLAGLQIYRVALQRTAQIAVALERYRAHHGAIPEDPSALVPEFLDHEPLDPFNGEHMRIFRLPEECIVYSVGARAFTAGAGSKVGKDLLLDQDAAIRCCKPVHN